MNKIEVEICEHEQAGWFYLSDGILACKKCVEETLGYTNYFAAEMGKNGGINGGPARAAKLSPERRREIAKLAANKRWGNE